MFYGRDGGHFDTGADFNSMHDPDGCIRGTGLSDYDFKSNDRCHYATNRSCPLRYIKCGKSFCKQGDQGNGTISYSAVYYVDDSYLCARSYKFPAGFNL